MAFNLLFSLILMSPLLSKIDPSVNLVEWTKVCASLIVKIFVPDPRILIVSSLIALIFAIKTE